MENGITRRSMLGMGMIGALAAQALVAEAAKAEEAPAAAMPEMKTPEDVAAKGESWMGLGEINARRRALIDSKTEDWVCADGTVIPNVWVKARTLVNTYGMGVGSELTDDCFNVLMDLMSEEEAELFVKTPLGIPFTAADVCEDTDETDEDKVERMLYRMSQNGMLYRVRRAGVNFYNHIAVAHGIYEYNMNKFYDGQILIDFGAFFTADQGQGYWNSGTGFYYVLPCDKQVVGDNQILPLEDIDAIIDRNEYIVVSPCQCRLANTFVGGVIDQVPQPATPEMKDFMSPLCGHPLETCLTFGEEAQYYIENNIGRRITKQEAHEIADRSRQAGMVFQSEFTRGSETVCSCHGDCCGVLGTYQAIGVEGCAEANCYPNISRYTLEYDKDSCLQCGLCVDRCVMGCIAMDDEGYPQVDARCVRCGQCGMVCPVEARKLQLKPRDEYMLLPGTKLDFCNNQAGFRFEHGTIY